MAAHKINDTVRWKALARDCRRFRTSIPRGLRAFGRDVGLDKATICRAEQGRPLTVGSYFLICMAYGLDPWDYIKQRTFDEFERGLHEAAKRIADDIRRANA